MRLSVLGSAPVGWRAQWLRLALMGAGLLALASCSDDSSRPENSELRVDPPATSTNVGAAPARPASADASATGPLVGIGRRYQVAVGTAYFFDQPEQSTPNGRYLRRGDTFYGEGETNGFVKTGFVQPDGAAGTAWLKGGELRQLPGSSETAKLLPRAPAAQPARAQALPEASTPAGQGQTAVVQSARAYFHTSPDLLTPRKAYCERGDKVRILDAQGPAVYVTFTNWEKVTTTGWMRRTDLQ
ncbi:hypothetical protein MUN81_13180 [Hymenobacter sp. 5317J-9]|uniref:hypothetical protein n=1 Tax=Hymenobacter sp. 5317J-9 TaxID=2932250 RepID=UPI001FD6819C|nr:hypothetical protein [Hymenobacter sp. 5317J-9]UOQ96205.1 hypothetical protein MUN81_13180 [Hymenobacter sp. 5317J-9]